MGGNPFGGDRYFGVYSSHEDGADSIADPNQDISLSEFVLLRYWSGSEYHATGAARVPEKLSLAQVSWNLPIIAHQLRRNGRALRLCPEAGNPRIWCVRKGVDFREFSVSESSTSLPAPQSALTHQLSLFEPVYRRSVVRTSPGGMPKFGADQPVRT